jgi:EAL domain-containing protein (putative c-di-GMP-specific phosphodiesterase class I)
VRPISVRLDTDLTSNLSLKSDLERRRLKSMVELLHHYEIQAAARDLLDPRDAELCKELGIDLADGPLFGEPLPLPSQPLPDTNILGTAEVERLFAAGPEIGAEDELGDTHHGGTHMYQRDMAESSSDSVL